MRMSVVDDHSYQIPLPEIITPPSLSSQKDRANSSNGCTNNLAAKVAAISCCLCIAAVAAVVVVHFLTEAKWEEDFDKLLRELRASKERITELEKKADSDEKHFLILNERIDQLENRTDANGQCANCSRFWNEMIGVKERITRLENETGKADFDDYTEEHLQLMNALLVRIQQLENATVFNESDIPHSISDTTDQCRNCSQLWQEIMEAKDRILKLENTTVAALDDTITSCLLNLTAAEEHIEYLQNRGICNYTVTSCEGVTLQEIPYNLRNATGGEVEMEIPAIGKTKVFCDLATDNGSWIVFQRRMDGSVEFYRNWDDYVNGFGTPRGEFWLGLEALYQLTNSGHNELRLDMIEINGTHYHAEYNSFRVGGASENYKLYLGEFSGNVRDSLTYANGQPFSTKDNDNDPYMGSCAHLDKSAWWYKSCQYCNLNGVYGGTTINRGIRWRSGNDDLFMKFTEMKIRMN